MAQRFHKKVIKNSSTKNNLNKNERWTNSNKKNSSVKSKSNSKSKSGKFNKNNKINPKINTNSIQNHAVGAGFSIFQNRYDSNFGKGTFDKLINMKNTIANDIFIRINLSKTSIEEVETFLIKNRAKFSKTFISNALKIEKSFFNLSSSLLSLTSKIYFQDLASQVPVNLIDFTELKKKNKIINILDMAASPGSKTTQIIDLLKYNEIEYNLIALEPNKIRLNRLVNNLQKHNFNNVEIFNIGAEKFISKIKFDLILLDAPCSGNLIGDKNWLKKRNVMGVEQSASLQRKLLKGAKSLLSQNGKLIYSTCSLEIEENENNVSWAVKNLNLKIISPMLNSNPNLNFNFDVNSYDFIKDKSLFDEKVLRNSIRLMPYVSKTQGFFVCVFENN